MDFLGKERLIFKTLMMSKLKLEGKDLRAIGYPESPVISIAMKVMEKNYKHQKKDKVLETLKSVLLSPAEYADDAVLGIIAQQLLPKPVIESAVISLNHSGIVFNTFGADQIEQSAMNQMYQAAKLPIAVAGALMPDAHAGYGLPIGGVLAVDNAVIPYGVGVDIGCRMCLSIFDIDPKELVQKEVSFSRYLNESTLFGAGRQFEKNEPNEVIDRKEFDELPILKGMRGKAIAQLGTSGSGNHFVEFGIINIEEWDLELGIVPGNYLGLLSHSGSRALGAKIATHYTLVAKQKRRLPGEANNLAWLHLEEEAGIEYWMAMNLAGDYAAACHHVIHEKIATVLGRQPITIVENHHNFAWKEIHEGRELIVHRKGATPAGKGILGVIPGSMTAPGFVVKGKGEPASLSSASHGAGRTMSRTRASGSISKELLEETLEKFGVKLTGGFVDEAPQAYKDIEVVMAAQKQLVDVIAKFTPKIVRMDGPAMRR